MRLHSLSIAILLFLALASSILSLVPLEGQSLVEICNYRPKPAMALPLDAATIADYSLPTGEYFARTDPVTGYIQLIVGKGITVRGFSQVDETNAAAAAMVFVEQNRDLFGVNVGDLRVESVNWLKNRAYVHIRQHVNSIPVWGGDLNLVIFPNGKVGFIRNDLIPEIVSSNRPALSEEAALELALGYIEPTSQPRRIDHLGLYVYPIWEGNSVSACNAWVFQIMSHEPLGLWQVAIDAASGEILTITNELKTVEVSGSLTGQYHEQFMDDPLEIAPWANAQVGIGTFDFYTDVEGYWVGDVTSGSPWDFATGHYGRYCNVNNGAGSDVSYSTTFPTIPFAFGWTLATSTEDEMNIYYHVNKIHAYVNDTLGFSGMNYCMPCLVNDPSTADNAYWDGTGINFGAGASVFNDLSLFCDIVYHEYTHGVTHHIYPYGALPYTGQSGAMDEGFSDYFPCSMTDDPLIGDGGLYISGTPYMRRCNTSRRYPEDWVGEVHADAQIIDAAWWEIREMIGRGQTDSLIHLTRFTFAEDFEEFFWATLTTDDDDGDISNGTPNARLIYESYGAHGIGPGFNLKVDHEPLCNTEVTIGNYSVQAIFTATLGIQEDSARVTYRLDGGSWTSIGLSFAFGVYRANIPAQPYGTTIDYYIYCLDNGSNILSSPPGTPTVYHTFNVEMDSTAPTVFATPVGQWFELAWPPKLTATVTDDHGLAGVEIHGQIGSTVLTPTLMIESDTAGIWHGVLPGLPAGNDTVNYWIEATDVALSPHTTRFPAASDFVTVVAPGYNEDMEIVGRGLETYNVRSGYVNEWTITPENSPYSTGGYSYAFTGAGGEYSDQASGALCTPELRIGDPATLTFWHRMNAEDDSEHFGYAWDGGIVEVSTDGGLSWDQVFPTPGYNLRIRDNDASPFAMNTECYSGEINWREETIDMAPFYPKAMVRFQFGSDAHVTNEGWFIDDVQLITTFPNVGENPSKPTDVSIQGVHPNPFNAVVVIEYSLLKGEAADLCIFDISGRMVRTISLESANTSVLWDGVDNSNHSMPSGIYFAKISIDDSNASTKLVLLK